MVEVAVASIGLRALLGYGGDLTDEALPLLDTRGHACGELRVSVLASEAATHLFGPRSWGKERLELELHSVALEASAAATPAVQALDRLWLEVDLMGVLPEETGLLTAQVPRRAYDGSGTEMRLGGLTGSWEVPLEEGSAALTALRAALRSVEEQDSDVYFVLKAGLGPEHPDELDDTAEGPGLQVGAVVGALRAAAAADDSEEELGTALVNLEDLLKHARAHHGALSSPQVLRM